MRNGSRHRIKFDTTADHGAKHASRECADTYTPPDRSLLVRFE
jgi:hypothetical protein